MSNFYFKQIEVGPMENFCYLLGDALKKEAVIIDPAWEVDRVLKIAEQDEIKITAALISHHHRDHNNGIPDLLTKIDCPVYIQQHDAEFVDVPKSNLIKSKDGDVMTVGDLPLQFVFTPGHTPGSQCFLIHNHLACGDTLFIDGCGRCDLPGGNAETMYYTLNQKIMMMPETTIVLPGHNYGALPLAKLGEQKRSNPYLRLAAESLMDFLKFRNRPR